MQEVRYYINALYVSFFSREFYADLIQNRRMFGMRYLLIMCLIAAIPVAVQVKSMIGSLFASPNISSEENIDQVESQMPEIRVKDGEFIIDGIHNINIVSRSGNVLAIFDVENVIDDLDDHEKVVIFNRNGVRLKLGESRGTIVMMTEEIVNSLDQYFVSDSKGKKLNKEKFFDDVRKVSNTPVIFIVIFSVVWFFTKYFISALMYSFAAGIFMAVMVKNNSFDFRQCLRISIFTLTPVIFLDMLSYILGYGLFAYSSVVYFITHILYIHFAVESYKRLGSVTKI